MRRSRAAWANDHRFAGGDPSASRSHCGRVAAQWTSADGMRWDGIRDTLDWVDPFGRKPDWGSTGRIIRAVEEAPPGTKWAIGTELHLVNRLKHEHPEQEIHFLSPVVCMCATMYRIDLAHLCWAVENLAAGTVLRRRKKSTPSPRSP